MPSANTVIWSLSVHFYSLNLHDFWILHARTSFGKFIFMDCKCIGVNECFVLKVLWKKNQILVYLEEQIKQSLSILGKRSKHQLKIEWASHKKQKLGSEKYLWTVMYINIMLLDSQLLVKIMCFPNNSMYKVLYFLNK